MPPWLRRPNDARACGVRFNQPRPERRTIKPGNERNQEVNNTMRHCCGKEGDWGLETNFRFQRSEVRFQISDFRFQVSEVCGRCSRPACHLSGHGFKLRPQTGRFGELAMKQTVVKQPAQRQSSVPTVLSRALGPIADCLTPAASRQLLKLSLDKKSQARLDELADKCTEGELTLEERAEYESAVLSLELVMLLQVEAQATLAASESR